MVIKFGIIRPVGHYEQLAEIVFPEPVAVAVYVARPHSLVLVPEHGMQADRARILFLITVHQILRHLALELPRVINENVTVQDLPAGGVCKPGAFPVGFLFRSLFYLADFSVRAYYDFLGGVKGILYGFVPRLPMRVKARIGAYAVCSS